MEIGQIDAIEGIDYMQLTKERRLQVNAPLTATEVSQCRASGSLDGWLDNCAPM